MNLSDAIRNKWKEPEYRAKQTLNAKLRFSGVKFTRIHRERISSALKGKLKSKEHIAKQVATLKKMYASGERIPHNKGKTKDNYAPLNIVSKKLIGRKKSIAHKIAMSKSKQKLMRNPERKHLFIKRLLSACQRSPNNSEFKLLNICSGLPIRYVGDGSLVIGYKNPDFIVDGQNKLVELFGSFYHDRKLNPSLPSHRTESATKSYYKRMGYSCLIIKCEELMKEQNVRNKVESFISEHGEEVVV